MDPLVTIAVLYALTRDNRKPSPSPRRRDVRVIPVAGHYLPTSGKLSFEFQRTPTHRHNGIDLPAPEGTPVLAAADGTVQIATNAWRQGFTDYGRVVVIRHDVDAAPVWTLYAHLMQSIVTADQPVRAGDTIGFVGRTQYSAPKHTSVFGPRRAHLHFEVSPRAYPQPSTARRLDPVAWLRAEVEPRV